MQAKTRKAGFTCAATCLWFATFGVLVQTEDKMEENATASEVRLFGKDLECLFVACCVQWWTVTKDSSHVEVVFLPLFNLYLIRKLKKKLTCKISFQSVSWPGHSFVG